MEEKKVDYDKRKERNKKTDKKKDRKKNNEIEGEQYR